MSAPAPPLSQEPTQSNLIFRLEDVDDFGATFPERPEGWLTSNDYHSLDSRSIPNILYFHLKPDEFDQIAGLLDAPAAPLHGSLAVGPKAALAALEQTLAADLRRSGDLTMRLAVGIFASFVFALPVILNLF